MLLSEWAGKVDKGIAFVAVGLRSLSAMLSVAHEQPGEDFSGHMKGNAVSEKLADAHKHRKELANFPEGGKKKKRAA